MAASFLLEIPRENVSALHIATSWESEDVNVTDFQHAGKNNRKVSGLIGDYFSKPPYIRYDAFCEVVKFRLMWFQSVLSAAPGCFVLVCNRHILQLKNICIAWRWNMCQMSVVFEKDGVVEPVLKGAARLDAGPGGVEVRALFDEPKLIPGALVKTIDFMAGVVTLVPFSSMEGE